MPIPFKCPKCKRKLKTSSSNAGRTGKCPYCGNKTIIPNKANTMTAIKPQPKPEGEVDPLVQQTQAGIAVADGVASNLLGQITDFAIRSLGQHTLRRNIHNYNGANLAMTHGMDMANKLGLTEEQSSAITPFPQLPNKTSQIFNITGAQDPSANKVESTKETTHTQKGISPAWLLAALATGGLLTGGGIAMSKYVQPSNTVVVPKNPPAPIINKHVINPGEIGVDVQ